jgi:hypothetical protein
MPAEGGSTGWVYRSDAPVSTTPDERPAMLRWAATAERKASGFAERVVRKTSVPFEIVLLATLPATRWILWPFGGKRRRTEAPPAA